MSRILSADDRSNATPPRRPRAASAGDMYTNRPVAASADSLNDDAEFQAHHWAFLDELKGFKGRDSAHPHVLHHRLQQAGLNSSSSDELERLSVLPTKDFDPDSDSPSLLPEYLAPLDFSPPESPAVDDDLPSETKHEPHRKSKPSTPPASHSKPITPRSRYRPSTPPTNSTHSRGRPSTPPASKLLAPSSSINPSINRARPATPPTNVNHSRPTTPSTRSRQSTSPPRSKPATPKPSTPPVQFIIDDDDVAQPTSPSREAMTVYFQPQYLSADHDVIVIGDEAVDEIIPTAADDETHEELHLASPTRDQQPQAPKVLSKFTTLLCSLLISLHCL